MQQDTTEQTEYDRGFQAGQHDMNRIIVLREDLAYEKGWEQSEKNMTEQIDKLIIKARTEAYDKGYQAGANQMGNDPCVCGFWGNKK